MRVMLERVFACHLGRFRPDPDGTIMPDSLFDILPSSAEVIEPPSEESPTPDPDPVKSSFKEFANKKKSTKPEKSEGKPKPIPLSKVNAPAKR